MGRSFVRVIGLALAIIPLFAGFLPVLVDDRRRALQDLLAGTVVVHAAAELPAMAERAPAPCRGSSVDQGLEGDDERADRAAASAWRNDPRRSLPPSRAARKP